MLTFLRHLGTGIVAATTAFSSAFVGSTHTSTTTQNIPLTIIVATSTTSKISPTKEQVTKKVVGPNSVAPINITVNIHTPAQVNLPLSVDSDSLSNQDVSKNVSLSGTSTSQLNSMGFYVTNNSNSDFNLQTLNLSIETTGSIKLGEAYFYEGSTLLSSTLVTNGSIIFSHINSWIMRGTTHTYMIKTDLSDIGNLSSSLQIIIPAKGFSGFDNNSQVAIGVFNAVNIQGEILDISTTKQLNNTQAPTTLPSFIDISAAQVFGIPAVHSLSESVYKNFPIVDINLSNSGNQNATLLSMKGELSLYGNATVSHMYLFNGSQQVASSTIQNNEFVFNNINLSIAPHTAGTLRLSLDIQGISGVVNLQTTLNGSDISTQNQKGEHGVANGMITMGALFK